MMSRYTPSTTPDYEIQSYLDGLLREATENLAEAPQPQPQRKIEQSAVVLPFAEPPQSLPILELPKVVEPAAEPIVEVVVAEPEVTVDVAVETPVEVESAPVASAIDAPLFDEPFECLLFKVGGVKLAVPLVSLGSIYPLAELTPLFGQAEWFMGLMKVPDRQLRAVDSAKLVMPERYQPSMAEEYHYLLSIHGVDWALAVDDIESSVTLRPEQVRWRTKRGARPWLAGTVVDQMCAILDLDQMAKMFA